MISGGLGDTVIGHQGEEQQDTALRGTSAKTDDQGGVFPHPYDLAPFSEKGQDCIVVLRVARLLTRCWGMIELIVQHVLLLQMLKGQVEYRGDGILCRAVQAVSKLK